MCFRRNSRAFGGSHCLYAPGFRFYFTPLPGFFSPFPHGTGSLSVNWEYLALEDGPPSQSAEAQCCSDRISRVPPYSISPIGSFRIRDCHPLWCAFPDTSASCQIGLRAVSRSLVATEEISIDFFSSGYLDISVPRVRLHTLCIQVRIPDESGGFPHSDISGS